jgi:hypothetical protein
MAKSSSKEPTLSSHLLSQRAPHNERVLPHIAKELPENSAPSSYIWALRKRPKYPYTRSYNSSPHKGMLVNT